MGGRSTERVTLSIRSTCVNSQINRDKGKIRRTHSCSWKLWRKCGRVWSAACYPPGAGRRHRGLKKPWHLGQHREVTHQGKTHEDCAPWNLSSGFSSSSETDGCGIDPSNWELVLSVGKWPARWVMVRTCGKWQGAWDQIALQKWSHLGCPCPWRKRRAFELSGRYYSGFGIEMLK